MTTTRFYEEHDLLPGTRVPLDPEAEHAYEAKVAEAIEAELDHAVGRGALRSAERDRWRDRLRREPDLATEILRDLPPNPDVADRNFAEDPRLRRLGNAFAEYMEVPEEAREIHYSPDEDLSPSERAFKTLSNALKPGADR